MKKSGFEILILIITIIVVLSIDIHLIPFRWFNFQQGSLESSKDGITTLKDTTVVLDSKAYNTEYIRKIEKNGYDLIFTNKGIHFITSSDSSKILKQIVLPEEVFIDHIVIGDFIYSTQKVIEESYSDPGAYAINVFVCDSLGFRPALENKYSTIYYRIQDGVKQYSQPMSLLDDGDKIIVSDQYLGYHRSNTATFFTFREYLWNDKSGTYSFNKKYVRLSSQFSKWNIIIPFLVILIFLLIWRIKQKKIK